MASGRARIVQYPFAAAMQGALLDSYDEAQRGKQLGLTLNLRSLEKTASELLVREGTIYERIQGRYVPIRLHFSGVSGLKNQDFFTILADIPLNDPARTLNDLLSWRQPE